MARVKRTGKPKRAPCKSGMIRRPDTQRCIKKGGPTHKRLIKEGVMTEKGTPSPRKTRSRSPSRTRSRSPRGRPRLVGDVRMEIALQSDDVYDVLNQCKTDREMAIICRDDVKFWKRWYNNYAQKEKISKLRSWKENAMLYFSEFGKGRVGFISKTDIETNEGYLYNVLYVTKHELIRDYNNLIAKRINEYVDEGLDPTWKYYERVHQEAQRDIIYKNREYKDDLVVAFFLRVVPFTKPPKIEIERNMGFGNLDKMEKTEKGREAINKGEFDILTKLNLKLNPLMKGERKFIPIAIEDITG